MLEALRAWLRRVIAAPAPATTRARPAARAPARTGAEADASTPELVATLAEGRSAEARERAARELGRRISRERAVVVPALVDGAFDVDASVRRAAREPLSRGNVGEPVEGLVDALRKGLGEAAASDRRSVISTLGSFVSGTPEFFCDVVRLLGDEDPSVRDTAAYYVAESTRHGRPRIDGVLSDQMVLVRRALGDPSATARRYLARAILQIDPDDEPARRVLVETLVDPKALEHQLGTVVDLLLRIGAANARRVLDAADEGLARRAPRRAWLAVGRATATGDDESGGRALAAMLAPSEPEDVRAEAARVARKLPPDAAKIAAPAIMGAAASDRSERVRALALKAVPRAHVPAEERIGLARAAVGERHREVRSAGLELLGTLRGERDLDVVAVAVPLLGDDAIAEEAARALFWIGAAAAPATPALVRRIRSDAPYAFFYALEQIGPPARAALPALVAVAAAPGTRRKDALGAIAKIGLGDDADAHAAALVKILDGEPEHYDVCLQALETATDPVPPAVREALARSVATQRGSAADRARRVRRLGVQGPESTATLVRALEDADENVADVALRTLQALGPAAVPELERIAGDATSRDRARAVFALEEMGARPRPFPS